MRLFDMTATVLQAWGQRLDLMQEMFQRNGAIQQGKEAAVAKCELRAAMMTCLKCDHSETCEEWLAETGETSDPPAFCPNGHRIARLRQDSEPRAA